MASFARVLGASVVVLAARSAVQAVDFDLAESGATKTAYYNQSSYAVPVNASEAAGFTLVQLQQVIRHGASYPTAATAQEIAALVDKLNKNAPSVIPSWLQGYRTPYDASVDGLIASKGGVELQTLATRVRKTLGGEIPTAFSSDCFLIQHTAKSRNKYGALNFATGFFSNWGDVTYTELASSKSLSFYDLCPRYTREVLQNPATFAQAEAYKAAMAKSVSTLKSKLKLPSGSTLLTPSDVLTVYSACAYDLALYNIKNNWCTLVTKDLARAAEYVEDLEWFYAHSSGSNKLNYEVATPLLQDIYRNLKDFAAGDSKIRGNFRIVEPEAVLPLLTLLGVVEKTPLLLAGASTEAIETRSFRTSRFVTFAANIEIRLLKSKANGGFAVQLRVNEQAVKFPGCGDKVFCPLEDVEKIWAFYVTQYDFDANCK